MRLSTAARSLTRELGPLFPLLPQARSARCSASVCLLARRSLPRSSSAHTMSAPAAAPSDAAQQLSAVPGESPKAHVSFLVCGTRFDVDRKYKLIKPIGTGAYGVVWSERSAQTTQTQQAANGPSGGRQSSRHELTVRSLCAMCRAVMQLRGESGDQGEGGHQEDHEGSHTTQGHERSAQHRAQGPELTLAG